MLIVDGVTSGYGRIPIVHDVTLKIDAGEWLAVVGPSGAGKSTLLKTIAGLLPTFRGSLRLGDEDVTQLPAHERVRAGIALVPEGRRLFAGMTVTENLVSGGFIERQRAVIAERIEKVFQLFPPLRARARQQVASLSGGEQQMCAIGRALMSRPKLLLVDELSLGLAPVLVERLIEALLAIKRTGATLVVVDQNVRTNLAAGDRAVVLRGGRIVRSEAARVLLDDPRLVADYFGRANPSSAGD